MTTPERTFVVCSSFIGCGLVLECCLLVLLAARYRPASGPDTAVPVAATAAAPSPIAVLGAFLFGSAVGLLVFATLLAIYLLPTIIAFCRGHQSWMAIAALNCFGTIFLGIAWFPALLWSLAGVWSRENTHHHYHHAAD